MKAGVSMCPCASSSTPVRAAPSRWATVKRIGRSVRRGQRQAHVDACRVGLAPDEEELVPYTIDPGAGVGLARAPVDVEAELPGAVHPPMADPLGGSRLVLAPRCGSQPPVGVELPLSL